VAVARVATARAATARAATARAATARVATARAAPARVALAWVALARVAPARVATAPMAPARAATARVATARVRERPLRTWWLWTALAPRLGDRRALRVDVVGSTRTWRRHGRSGTCRFGRGRVALPSSLLRSREGMRSPRATETGRALLAVAAAAAAMGLQRHPLVAAADMLGRGFDAVLPPVVGTLDAPRSALRRVGTPAQARGVSFAEGVRGDARKCLTRARRERRAERVARRATRATRVVVEESARSQTPPRRRGRAPPPSPLEGSRGRAARRGRGPRG
jgi:hypothetical protein